MYVQLAEIPLPTAAQFASSNIIRLTSSIRDHVRNEKRIVTKSIFVETSVTSTQYEVAGDVISSTISPSGKRRAVLLEKADTGGTSKKRYVEVWLGDKLEASMDVSDRHGSFYADDHLSSLSFSPSETSFLYTAEAKAPSTQTDPYERFRFVPQFGEGLAGKKRPTIYIFRWDASSANSPTTLTELSIHVPATVLFGQATFSPDTEDKIYSTGYELLTDGRLLGVKGCHNRPTGIWELTLPLVDSFEAIVECTARKLTPSYLSCRSPRVLTYQGSSRLFWLSDPTGGPHAATTSLHSLEIHSGNTDASVALIDTVRDPRADGFPGLYPGFNLPALPFLRLKSGPHIVTHSTWGSRSTVLLVSTSDGQVKDLTPDTDGSLYSWSVLATDGQRRVICLRSAISVPHEVVLGEFDDDGGVQWRVIEKYNLDSDVETALSSLQTTIIPIPDRHPTETIVIQSTKSGSVPPCIVVPHGGPHATTTTSFSASTAALALEGYTLSLPNYTGSLGFGQKAVEALVGGCGTVDVQDCIASARHLIDLRISEQGPGKQFVMGGSHGGFLTAHLIGQFPDMFSAAVLRNPVISSGEISTSDIPDWYFSEFGHKFPVASMTVFPESEPEAEPPVPPLMTAGIFAQLQAASPIAHVDAVRTPVLLLVGAADLRVAPTQGIEFYHALKGRRRKVELLVFEGESHPLDGVEAARVGWEAAREWFSGERSEAS